MPDKVISLKNGNYIELYRVGMEERSYFEREKIADFVTNLIYSTNSNLKVTKKDYSNMIMNSILCVFDIQYAIPLTKIYLN